MIRTLFISTIATILIASCDRKEITWVSTTQDATWQTRDTKVIRHDRGDAETVIETDSLYQTIDGFGTCFNELGWTSLSLLADSDRQAVLTELFAPGTGANFTVCRMPVGANDFSRNWYSYNETDGDFAMNDFTVDNDRETLIPFIRNALRYNPELKIWASPWSPPSWMKDNLHYACQPLDTGVFDNIGSNGLRPDQVRREGLNMFIQEDAYFQAYALYFSKFIQAYREAGIHIFMVAPQNEFNSCQPFPSCTWLPSGLNRFVGQHLGPQMQALGVDIMFGTMERPDPALVDTLLQDPHSSLYIQSVGFQWAGKHAIGAIHKQYPDMKLYQTEQECGNGQNDWRMCRYSWELMLHYLTNGANVYEYWNTSLTEGGVSRWGWRQNSLVTVNPDDRTYKYNFEYYLIKHFSHYVLPGAKRVHVSGTTEDILAFVNLDGSLVTVLFNRADAPVTERIRIKDEVIEVPLQAQSFNTLVIRN